MEWWIPYLEPFTPVRRVMLKYFHYMFRSRWEQRLRTTTGRHIRQDRVEKLLLRLGKSSEEEERFGGKPITGFLVADRNSTSCKPSIVESQSGVSFSNSQLSLCKVHSYDCRISCNYENNFLDRMVVSSSLMDELVVSFIFFQKRKY